MSKHVVVRILEIIMPTVCYQWGICCPIVMLPMGLGAYALQRCGFRNKGPTYISKMPMTFVLQRGRLLINEDLRPTYFKEEMDLHVLLRGPMFSN